MASQGALPADDQRGPPEQGPEGGQPGPAVPAADGEPQPAVPAPRRLTPHRRALDKALLYAKISQRTKFWLQGACPEAEMGEVSYNDVARVIHVLQAVIQDEVKLRGVCIIPGFLKVVGKKVKKQPPKVIKVRGKEYTIPEMPAHLLLQATIAKDMKRIDDPEQADPPEADGSSSPSI
ncbi:unnamed protein product, partial [Prorocentrum cordatum]